MALLEIKNLVKNYGDVEALKGINLSIEKGEVVVILGPSGCGKSTFLRCLNGLEEIKSGQILLQNAGELGKDIPWVKARQRIGMVFQSYELFAHLSVIDNILLGPLKVQKRDRAEAEKQANIRRAEGLRESQLLEAEGKANAIEQIAKAESEAIMKVNQAIINSGTDERVIALKQVEALKEMANNPANKLILPNETLSSLGSIAAIGEMLKKDK